jgi:hypothetical protein
MGNKEINAMSENIVNAVNNTTNDYDAREVVFSIIQNAFIKEFENPKEDYTTLNTKQLIKLCH